MTTTALLALLSALALAGLAAYRRAQGTRTTVVNTEGALLDGGSIQVRTGAAPTNVDDPAQGTLLGTLTFTSPAFATGSLGVASAHAIASDTSADASGTALHARLLNSGGTVRADCTCGLGSGDINFDNNVIVSGGTIAITSATMTAPV
jgi:hypothetical protein